MKIVDVLNKKGHDYCAVGANEMFDQVVRSLVSHGVGSLIVTDPEGAPIGIVSERSLVETFARLGRRAVEETARSVMRTPMPVCRPDLEIREAMAMMTALRTRHLVVADGTNICGVISLGDLVKHRLRDTELENLVLKEMAGAHRLFSDPGIPSALTGKSHW